MMLPFILAQNSFEFEQSRARVLTPGIMYQASIVLVSVTSLALRHRGCVVRASVGWFPLRFSPNMPWSFLSWPSLGILQLYKCAPPFYSFSPSHFAWHLWGAFAVWRSMFHRILRTENAPFRRSIFGGQEALTSYPVTIPQAIPACCGLQRLFVGRLAWTMK